MPRIARKLKSCKLMHPAKSKGADLVPKRFEVLRDSSACQLIRWIAFADPCPLISFGQMTGMCGSEKRDIVAFSFD